MITAFFTPYYKFLQKDNYLKFFNEVESLNDLIDKIKVEDKIKIYAHSKDIIKFQFNNTNSNVEYEFLEDGDIFEKIINSCGMVKGIVKQEWRYALGSFVYFVQDRDMQVKVVNDYDVLAFQPTDINELSQGLLRDRSINDLLVYKLFFTDKEIEKMGVR